MVLLNVTLPDGLLPGDSFQIASPHTGKEYVCVVPDKASGSEIAVDISDDGPDSGPEMVLMSVTVPDGLLPGDLFSIEAFGALFEIAVPEGYGGGCLLEVEVPAPEGGAAACEHEQDAEAELSRVPTRDCLDGSAWPDEDWAVEEPPPPAGGTHAVGARVKVKRTDGNWSPAQIVEYDESGDWYTVRVEPGGQLKYLVTDSEIMPIEYEQEQCGEHFVGRRVQVPFVGAESKDEVCGEVRGFNEATQTYCVALDCGRVKKHLRADEVRVRKARGQRK
jgi:hypothetical protein